jgi:hypothetical protein
MITTSLMLGLLIFLLAFALIWLALLTFYLHKITRHYHTLTQGINKKNLETIIENLIKDVGNAKNDVAKLINRCDTIEKNDIYHIQKIGLLRFNPFKDTGGDQSFILSFADARDSGVVITGLYSRSGLRWYAKRVVEGKGIDNELSEEEKKTLKIAKNIKQI